MAKKSLPLSKVYQLIEPGPVVLVTTARNGKPNVMTLSWHMMMEFEPPQIGCIISNRSHSFQALQETGECVINIPAVEIAEQVTGVGNISDGRTDKFKKFNLTPVPASKVAAPLIDECFASLECRVIDDSRIDPYCLFILEVVKAWIDPTVKNPRTIHHQGNGRFTVDGEIIQLESKMK